MGQDGQDRVLVFPIHGINKLLGLGARDRDPLTTRTTPPPSHNQQFARKKETEKKAGKTHISSNTKQITTMQKCRKLMIRKQLRVSNTMIYLVKLHPLCTMLRDMMETLYHVDFAWQWTNWPTRSFEANQNGFISLGKSNKSENDILCDKLIKRPSIKNDKIKENREISFDEVGRATIRRPSPFPGGEAARAKYASPANRSSHFLVP